MTNTTHFGYKTVAEDDKVREVAKVFHSVAAKYDVMNDLMSGGLHRLWKTFTIANAGVRPGFKVLDIAGGRIPQGSRLAGWLADYGSVGPAASPSPVGAPAGVPHHHFALEAAHA